MKGICACSKYGEEQMHWLSVLLSLYAIWKLDCFDKLLARKSIKGLFVRLDFKFFPNDKII